MKKIDFLFFKFSGIIIIVSAVILNISVEHLTDIGGYSSSTILFSRGVIAFFFTLFLSMRYRVSIIPLKYYFQLFRLVNSGISLLLIFQSFRYLEASSVSMVQRLDIPFAVLIGFITGQRKHDYRIGLSVFACCLVLSIFFFAKQIGEKPIGLIFAIIGVIQLSLAYLLAKKSTGEENNFVIVNTTNIGCIIVGLTSGVIFGNLTLIKPQDFGILYVASIFQFILHYLSCVLYRHHDVAIAQRPYLLSAFVILIVEQILDKRVFDLSHNGIIIFVIVIIYLVTLKEGTISKLQEKFCIKTVNP